MLPVALLVLSTLLVKGFTMTADFRTKLIASIIIASWICALSPLSSGAHITPHPMLQPLYRDAAAPVEVRVEDLLKRMTLEEKVAAAMRSLARQERIS